MAFPFGLRTSPAHPEPVDRDSGCIRMMGAAASWPTAIKEFFNNLLHYVIGRTGSLSTRNFISAAQTGQTAYAVQTWNAV